MEGEMKRPQHPHFWIPDEQVVQKEYDPTSRSKPRPVHHSVHGQKLLSGLQTIEEFHRQLSSPWANEMMVFKVELAPGEKVQNKVRQDFLTQKGVEIVAVKDRKTAIAATTPTRFKRLKEKVAEYQVRGANGDFQYFDGFSSFGPDDKHAESIKRVLSQPVVPEGLIDVQIVLLPSLTQALYTDAIAYLSTRIREDGGDLVRSPYRLSDQTPVLRALMPPGSLNAMASEEVVFRVEETSFFQVLDPLLIPDNITQCTLAHDIVMETLPVVAVLDTGVTFDHAHLDELIVTRWVAPGIAMTTPAHGTGVASRVMFGDHVEVHAASGILRPRCRIADGCISDGQPVSQDQMIERIRAAVDALHGLARVFNLSFNATKPIDGDVLSLLSYELDVLCQKYNVQFVVSAGNHYLWRTDGVTLGDILEDSDSFIASPADSVLALTVGAISRTDAPGSVSQKEDPSPFSRRGPGFAGNQKPDLVAPGGNILMDQDTGEQVVPPAAAAWVLTPQGGLVPTCGTSFAAPVVAGDLAVVDHSLPMDNLLLAKALLIHTGGVFWDDEGLDLAEREVYASVYGAGLSRPDRAVQSAASSVTFVRTGELNRLTKEHVRFHMPSVLASMGGNNSARVRVTCVSHPPLDRSKGPDYCCTYVSASLHKIDQKGRLPASNPDSEWGRRPWQPYQHFDKPFSRFSPGDWEVWLQLWTRWDVSNDQKVPYALVITVEDPSSTVNVYEAVKNEAGNRYTPLNRLRPRG